MKRFHGGDWLGLRNNIPRHWICNQQVNGSNPLAGSIEGRKGVSADTALRLEHYLGISSVLLVQLQSGFDLSRAAAEKGIRSGDPCAAIWRTFRNCELREITRGKVNIVGEIGINLTHIEPSPSGRSFTVANEGAPVTERFA